MPHRAGPEIGLGFKVGYAGWGDGSSLRRRDGGAGGWRVRGGVGVGAKGCISKVGNDFPVLCDVTVDGLDGCLVARTEDVEKVIEAV